MNDARSKNPINSAPHRRFLVAGRMRNMPASHLPFALALVSAAEPSARLPRAFRAPLRRETQKKWPAARRRPAAGRGCFAVASGRCSARRPSDCGPNEVGRPRQRSPVVANDKQGPQMPLAGPGHAAEQ